MQAVHFRLNRVATTLELHETFTNLSGFRLQRILTLFSSADCFTQLAHFLFATDHAGMYVLVAAHAQPVTTDPDAVARDDRLAIRERATQRKRLWKAVDSNDAGEQ